MPCRQSGPTPAVVPGVCTQSTGAHLATLVRAGAKYENGGVLVERQEQAE
ncbi:hypothetical protein [Streptomyces sp. NPDC048643]